MMKAQWVICVATVKLALAWARSGASKGKSKARVRKGKRVEQRHLLRRARKGAQSEYGENSKAYLVVVVLLHLALQMDLQLRHADHLQ